MKLYRVNGLLPPELEKYHIKDAPDYLCIEPISGLYWVDIYRKDRLPSRLSRSTKAKTKTLAKRIAEDMVSKWLGQELKTGEKRKVLISETCDDVIKSIEAEVKAETMRQRTLDNYYLYVGKNPNQMTDQEKENQIKRRKPGFQSIREMWGHLLWDQWSDEFWLKFKTDFQNRFPSKMLSNHWKHLSAVVNHAHKCGYVNKGFNIENPDPERKTGRVATPEEIENLFKVARPDLRDQMLFACTMGMRLREHLRQSWDKSVCCHVDLERKVLTVCEKHSKIHKARTINLSPQVYSMLVRRKNGLFLAADGYYRKKKIVSKKWVFPAPGNPNTWVKSNSKSWRTAKKDAGIKGRLKYHHLRHTFLTECAKQVRENTLSVVLVTTYCNLSIPTFERTYLHLDYKDTAPVSNLIAVKLREETIHEGVIQQ